MKFTLIHFRNLYKIIEISKRSKSLIPNVQRESIQNIISRKTSNKQKKNALRYATNRKMFITNYILKQIIFFICILISSLNRDAQGMKKNKKNFYTLVVISKTINIHQLRNRHRSTHDESRHFLIYLQLSPLYVLIVYITSISSFCYPLRK